MSVVELKKSLEKSSWLKEKTECHQQEAECLGSNRGVEKNWGQSELEFWEARIGELERRLTETSREEEEERMKMQRKLEGYEEKTLELKKMLMQRKRDLEVSSGYHRYHTQERHQFNIRLESKQKRRQEMKDQSVESIRGNNGTYTRETSWLAAFKTSGMVSSDAPVETSAAANVGWSEQHGQCPSIHRIASKEAASASEAPDAGDDYIDPTFDSEVIPDSGDSPFELDQERNSPIKISEVDAAGSFVRLNNVLSEEVDIGRFYVAQWRPGGKPSTSFQLPVAVILPGLTTVTIWSALSKSCHENPPTDFICERWLTGEDCTTVVCLPNQQAISWKNQPGRSSQKHRYADGRMEHEQRLMTGSDDIKAKEAENKASSLMKRSSSRLSSYNLKQKQDTAAAEKQKEEMKDGGFSGELADCEDGCEEEEEEDNTCEDTSSDDCGDDEDEDDECGAEEEDKLVDSWWGDRRCSLPKTIPGVSIHLDDFNTATMKKTDVQESDKESACRGREFNECSSNSSTEADARPCRGQAKDEGWILGWSRWFSRDEEKKVIKNEVTRCRTVEEEVDEDEMDCNVRCLKVTKGCCDERKVTREYCDEKNYFATGCCEDDVSMEGGCCADEKTAAKMKKMRRSGTCCEEEEEEDCVDPCQRTGGRFDSECRIDPHLPSGGTTGGRSLTRGGGGKIESSLGARVPVVKARKPL